MDLHKHTHRGCIGAQKSLPSSWPVFPCFPVASLSPRLPCYSAPVNDVNCMSSSWRSFCRSSFQGFEEERHEASETDSSILTMLCKPVSFDFRRRSGAETVSGSRDVYTRKGIRGYQVETRLLTGRCASLFATAYARDAVAFCGGQEADCNYREPKPCVPRPPHLRVHSIQDHEQIMNFMQQQAHEAARKANSWRRDRSRSNRRELKMSTGRLQIWSTYAEEASDTSDPATDPTDPELEPEKAGQAHFHYASQSDKEGWGSDSWGGSSIDSQADLTADSPCQESSRKRPRDPIDEADVFISKLASGIRKHVKEALDSALLPLVLAMRTREENEQEHREKLLALEIEKLDLKRQKRKLLLKRQPEGRSTGQSKGRHQITK